MILLGLLLPVLVVWSVRYPPQFDSMNHLARHVLEYWSLTRQPLPPGYEIHWRVLPNLGGDLVIPPLIALFGPLGGLRVFLSLALALSWLGPALFILTEGRWRPAAWVASLLLLPFLLNLPFYWGFLNFHSGVGIAFLAAVHLRTLDRRDWPSAAALAVHAPLVALLFLWHLGVLAIYLVLLGCTGLARLHAEWRAGRGWRRTLLRGAVLALPLLPLVPLQLAYAAQPESAATLAWLPLGRKLVLLLSIFRGYDPIADAIALLLAAGAALLFFARAPRDARPGFAGFAAVVFLAAYLVLPMQWRLAAPVDLRVLAGFLPCALAALAALPLRWSWAGMTMVVLALGIRAGDAAWTWRRLDLRLQDAARALPHVAPGASVLPISLMAEFSKEHAENHFAALAVVERRAYVPALFAFRDQQPLRITGETRLSATNPLLRPAGPLQDGVFTLADAEAASAYDYLWIYNPTGAALRLPPAWRREFAGETVSLWRHAGGGDASAGSPAMLGATRP